MILTLMACIALAGSGVLAAWLVGRWGRTRWPRLSRAVAGLILVIDLPVIALAAYLGWRLLAGQPGERELPFADGVIYRRQVLTTPNRAVVHLLEIDDAAAVRFTVTPPVQKSQGLRVVATYATDVDFDADVLINANFFTPFKDNWFLDYAPHAGDAVEPIGPVVADGVRYGRPKPDWPSFWVNADGGIGCGWSWSTANSPCTATG